MKLLLNLQPLFSCCLFSCSGAATAAAYVAATCWLCCCWAFWGLLLPHEFPQDYSLCWSWKVPLRDSKSRPHHQQILDVRNAQCWLTQGPFVGTLSITSPRCHNIMPTGILGGEMFLFFWRIIYCVLWKYFLTSNFFNWCAKNYCNLNKHFSSNFSFLVCKYFAPNLH